jgi:RNA-directed DNA polymerase
MEKVRTKRAERRLHAMYNKAYRTEVVGEAWKRVEAEGRCSAGIDGVTIQRHIVQEYGKG